MMGLGEGARHANRENSAVPQRIGNEKATDTKPSEWGRQDHGRRRRTERPSGAKNERGAMPQAVAANLPERRTEEKKKPQFECT